MALQTSVSLYPASGVAGQQVVAGQSVYTADNLLSDGTVKAGAFAFPKYASSAYVEGEVSATTTVSTEVPVGIVERVLDNVLTDVTADSSVVYPAGCVVTIALRGQYYIKAPSSGTTGNKILITPSTGVITVGASAGSGEVDTGWTAVAVNGGHSFAEGDLIIAQNFG